MHPGRDGRAATQNRNRRLHPLSPSAPQATGSASTWSNFPFCRAQAFPMGGVGDGGWSPLSPLGHIALSCSHPRCFFAPFECW